MTAKVGAEHFLGVTVQRMAKVDGYELILGSSIDPQFGPVLLFGTGGQLVEVFKDRSLALPPLNTTLARRMMEQTKIYKALKGVRGRKPVDMVARGVVIIEDRPFIDGPEVFVARMIASGEMPPAHARLYRTLFHQTLRAEHIRLPDLTVYLRTEPDLLERRRAKRAANS